jgi:chorismate mutase
MNTIIQLKSEINNINNELVDIIIRRIEISRKLGREKNKLGFPILNPSREVDIYVKLQQTNPEHFKYLKPIFEEILQQSRLIQN